MLRQACRLVTVGVLFGIGIPYAMAIFINLLNGRPLRKEQMRRALHPRRVFALNYAILRQLKYLQLLPLGLRWTYFYWTAQPSRLIKNIVYGTNQCQLDLYFPKSHAVNSDPKPIIIFMYGGAWGSGTKSYYGLLCCRLADQLNAVVCCPNYSTYPKGYVDDQIQDVVDCLSWLQENANVYGGDKSRVMLIGHSAGAHLCVMAVLELVVKRLQQDPSFATEASRIPIVTEPIAFEEKYFNGNNSQEQKGGGEMEGSYCVVSSEENWEGNSGSAALANSDNNRSTSTSLSLSYQLVGKDNGEEAAETGSKKDQPVPSDERTSEDEGAAGNEEQQAGDEREAEGSEVSESSMELRLDGDRMEEQAPKDRLQELKELLDSIKAVIGLAGVYHIGDHFAHEAYRMVEDISTMARAMYGEEHFERFSPTTIVSALPDTLSLPPMVLIHGTDDTTVPTVSSIKFAESVARLRTDINVRLLSEASHTDVCFDLMDTSRKYHDAVMGIIMDTANRLL